MNKLLAAVLCISFLAACGGGGEEKRDALSVTRIKAAELSEKAALAYEKGDFELSLKYYREALRLSRSVEDFDSMAVGAVNTAAALRTLGHLDTAGALLDGLLEMPHMGTTPALEAEARYVKALILLDKKDPDGAVMQSGLARKACQQSCDALPRIYNLSARASLETGDHATAHDQAQAGLEASRRARDSREEANALRLLAWLDETDGRFTESARHYEEALKLDKKLALGPKIYHDLMGLGRIAATLGDNVKADEYFGRALSVAEALGDAGKIVQARHSLAAIDENQ